MTGISTPSKRTIAAALMLALLLTCIIGWVVTAYLSGRLSAYPGAERLEGHSGCSSTSAEGEFQLICTQVMITPDSSDQVIAWINTRPEQGSTDTRWEIGCLKMRMHREINLDPAAMVLNDLQAQGTGIAMRSETSIDWYACIRRWQKYAHADFPLPIQTEPAR